MEPKPNVEFPLAVSYNERGLAGFANMSARDQYKVNYYYEPIKNSLTGDATLYLTKRPGATSTFNQTGATGMTEVYHLMTPINGIPTEAPWIIGKEIAGNSTIIASGSSSTTIFTSTSGSHHPVYTTAGLINSVDTRVVQVVFAGTRHISFYASSFGTWNEIVSTYSTHAHRGKIEIMDGFGFQLVSTNRIINTNINTISTWPAGNFITKQIVQDDPRGLARLRNQILAFGYDTVEVFHNGGLSPAPLVRIPYLTQRIGLQTGAVGNITEYYAVVGGRMYFNSNLAGAQAYDGSRFEKISTPAIDKIFFQNTPTSVDRIVFHQQEAVSFRLSNLTDSTQRALLFFPKYNEWFEWNSNVFKPIGNDIQFAGTSSHRTRTFMFSSTERWMDLSEHYSSVIQFKWPSAGSRQQMNVLGVIGDTQLSTTTSQLQVEFSDDDGQSYGSVRTIDMTNNSKKLTRCGPFRQRTVRLTHVGNIEIRLEKIFANIK